MNTTFSHFGKEGSIDIAKIFKDLQHDEDGLYKLKITCDLNKNYRTQLIPLRDFRNRGFSTNRK
ncbi:hypothetical protein LDL59_16250 [Kaistella anthropi]|nr:hypothetical protein [Kaistella anthropi]